MIEVLTHIPQIPQILIVQWIHFKNAFKCTKQYVKIFWNTESISLFNLWFQVQPESQLQLATGMKESVHQENHIIAFNNIPTGINH